MVPLDHMKVRALLFCNFVSQIFIVLLRSVWLLRKRAKDEKPKVANVYSETLFRKETYLDKRVKL